MNEHDWIDAAIEAVAEAITRHSEAYNRANKGSVGRRFSHIQFDRLTASFRRLSDLREHYRRLDTAKHTIETQQVIDTTTGEDLHP